MTELGMAPATQHGLSPFEQLGDQSLVNPVVTEGNSGFSQTSNGSSNKRTRALEGMVEAQRVRIVKMEKLMKAQQYEMHRLTRMVMDSLGGDGAEIYAAAGDDAEDNYARVPKDARVDRQESGHREARRAVSIKTNPMFGDDEVPQDDDWKESATGEWEEYLDEASGDAFFHNEATGETVWERPGGF